MTILLNFFRFVLPWDTHRQVQIAIESEVHSTPTELRVIALDLKAQTSIKFPSQIAHSAALRPKAIFRPSPCELNMSGIPYMMHSFSLKYYNGVESILYYSKPVFGKFPEIFTVHVPLRKCPDRYRAGQIKRFSTPA